jgi:hypothetical protein
MCTCICRTILDHVPIGKYYCWFNIPEAHLCLCRAARQLHEHIFTRCSDMDMNRCMPKLLNELIGYLQKILLAFGFQPHSESIG